MCDTIVIVEVRAYQISSHPEDHSYHLTGSQVAPIQAYASNLNRIPQWLHPRITSDIYAMHTMLVTDTLHTL